jgi:hypothetical protein
MICSSIDAGGSSMVRRPGSEMNLKACIFVVFPLRRPRLCQLCVVGLPDTGHSIEAAKL